MKCASCGNELLANVKFCTTCGAPVPPAPPAEVLAEKPPVQPTPAPPVCPVPPVRPAAAPAPQSRKDRPLGPWAYYGLKLLFSIPLIGFICLIIFSVEDGNIHRRNFARSYWCALLVNVILIILLVVLVLVLNVEMDVLSELESVLL